MIDNLWLGIAAFLSCGYFACLSMNPAALNISIAERVNAGEEAIGLVSFYVKGFVKLIPVAFGAGIILGAINLLMAMMYLFQDGSSSYQMATFAVSIIISAAVLPILGYIFFLFYYVTIDVLRSILIIPKKLDAKVTGDRSGCNCQS